MSTNYVKLEKDLMEILFLKRHELKEIFDKMDANKDGKLKKKEFIDGTEELMQGCAPRNVLEQIWNEIDKLGDGQICYAAFKDRFTMTVKLEKRFAKKFGCAMKFAHFESLKHVLVAVYHSHLTETGESGATDVDDTRATKVMFSRMSVRQKSKKEKKLTSDEFVAYVMQYPEALQDKVKKEDVRKLFQMFDEESRGYIDLFTFTKMLMVSDVGERTKAVSKKKIVHVELDLHHKRLRDVMNRHVRPDGKPTRAEDLIPDMEKLILQEMNGTKHNAKIELVKYGTFNYCLRQRGVLELHLERIVDCLKNERSGEYSVFCFFSLTYDSLADEVHHMTIYMGKMEFTRKEEFKSFEYEKALDRRDMQVVYQATNPEWDDWPEFGVHPDCFFVVDVDSEQFEKSTDVNQSGNERYENLADNFFKRKYAPIQVARPAFTVMELKKQFALLDGDGSGTLSLQAIKKAMMNVGESEEEANNHARSFFKLMNKKDDDVVHFEDFTAEYVRMQEFKALRTVTSLFDAHTYEGDVTMPREQFQAILVEYLGEEDARDRMDVLMHALHIGEEEEGISLKALAVWYFAYQTKLRMRLKMKKLAAREKEEVVAAEKALGMAPTRSSKLQQTKPLRPPSSVADPVANHNLIILEEEPEGAQQQKEDSLSPSCMRGDDGA